MTSLRPAATNMSYHACLPGPCAEGRTTHLEILPKPRVFSKSTLHTFLIEQSFIGHYPAVSLGDPSCASLVGTGLPATTEVHLLNRLLATEEEQARKRACAPSRRVQAESELPYMRKGGPGQTRTLKEKEDYGDPKGKRGVTGVEVQREESPWNVQTKNDRSDGQGRLSWYNQVMMR